MCQPGDRGDRGGRLIVVDVVRNIESLVLIHKLCNLSLSILVLALQTGDQVEQHGIFSVGDADLRKAWTC